MQGQLEAFTIFPDAIALFGVVNISVRRPKAVAPSKKTQALKQLQNCHVSVETTVYIFHPILQT
ncbi:hypothetical protein BX666DRAFT_1935428 [Dichotomocladium elegans]|nr:hypothetical protein BX666DRAFT_1935428 [Dichotomocladium elegans]